MYPRQSVHAVVISTSRTLSVLPQEEHYAYETGIILTLPRGQTPFSDVIPPRLFPRAGTEFGTSTPPCRPASPLTRGPRKTPRSGACAMGTGGSAGLPSRQAA